ncbi:PP2C family protein-serine/threonine phosphatase [Pseudonocardia sp. RS010]|uniref:PP2C family protein-serine/threonine phosphatase n=1 Tax=Pseudonocardia sp. RS010 TaxID=3385979 RepID=UPI00399F7D38
MPVTDPEHATGATLLEIDTRIDTAPHPAVVADAAGIVQALNRAARALLPGVRVGESLTATAPGWLAESHATLAGTPGPGGAAQGWVDRRSLEGHPVRHDDGTVTWWLVDDTDTRLAREALRTEQARTAFLTEVSTALLGSLNLQRCMETTVALATENLCDAAIVMAPARGGRYPTVTVLRGGEIVHDVLDVDAEEVPGLAEALQGFPPVPSRWLDPMSVPEWLRPTGFGEVGSIVVTPLPGHGVPAGALILVRGAGAAEFSEEEEVVARLFATRAGVAMSAARMYDQQASITETLMRDLLPPTVHQLPGVEFAARYRASQDGDRVGGDFYDVHPASVEDGENGAESLVVLGDVCGKGLDAAVLTGKIRSTLHALLPLADDHLRMLRLLNGALLNTHDARFATLVLASVARDGAGVRLRLTCGGHPAPLIVRADGHVEEAPTRGTLIGAIPDVRATTAELTLGPGETCLMYTDGITEAKGGPFGDELFGEQRLRRALGECAGMPAEAVVERVQMLASQWLGRGTHDDMAVLAITAPRGQHLTAVGGHGRGRYTA